MFLNIFEVLDIALMTLILGFLFMSTLKPIQRNTEDILDKYLKKSKSFDWHALWFAAMVTAPAIILHEFGHKITALSLGFTSTLHAACSTANIAAGGGFFDFYCGLTIASIVMKILNFGFIFFIPAFVETIGNATTIEHIMISIAGPLVNLALFLITLIILKTHKKLSLKMANFLTLTKNINLFLFIFNMIPIPGFDGFSVFRGLWILLGL
ncbi:MAG: hypothetical protein ACP5N1_00120 [Candidatus Woesearchaeota archaeon]